MVTAHCDHVHSAVLFPRPGVPHVACFCICRTAHDAGRPSSTSRARRTRRARRCLVLRRTRHLPGRRRPERGRQVDPPADPRRPVGPDGRGGQAGAAHRHRRVFEPGARRRRRRDRRRRFDPARRRDGHGVGARRSGLGSGRRRIGGRGAVRGRSRALRGRLGRGLRGPIGQRLRTGSPPCRRHGPARVDLVRWAGGQGGLGRHAARPLRPHPPRRADQRSRLRRPGPP